jgi:hypothetical protein
MSLHSVLAADFMGVRQRCFDELFDEFAHGDNKCRDEDL